MADILKTPLQLAIDALEHIADPIGTIKERAERDGHVVDWRFMPQLANDPSYLKGIASDALALLKQPTRT